MKKRYILGIVCLILFLIILVSILIGRNLFIDDIIINFISSFRNPTDTKISIVKMITLLGDKYFIAALVVIIGFILYVFKHKEAAYMLVLNLVNIVILNKGIKYLVQRPRPVNMLIEKDGYSFPSGHSMLSLGIYVFLMYLISKTNIKQVYKNIIYIILSIIILVVGFTRLYLGVHYPSDVIAGYLITTVYLIIFITYLNRKNIVFFK